MIDNLKVLCCRKRDALECLGTETTETSSSAVHTAWFDPSSHKKEFGVYIDDFGIASFSVFALKSLESRCFRWVCKPGHLSRGVVGTVSLAYGSARQMACLLFSPKPSPCMLCDCQHHKMIELVVALGTTSLEQVQARELRGIHLAACQKFRGRIHLRLLTNYTGSPKHCFSEPTVFPKLWLRNSLSKGQMHVLSHTLMICTPHFIRNMLTRYIRKDWNDTLLILFNKMSNVIYLSIYLYFFLATKFLLLKIMYTGCSCFTISKNGVFNMGSMCLPGFASSQKDS